jgi:hypothetical protein
MRFGRIIMAIALLTGYAMSVGAQQMEVTDFKRLRRGLLAKREFVTDKKMAYLDLYTAEEGFSFLANGRDNVEPEAGDGMITLKVPKKTRLIVIRHEKFGQTTWVVPGKPLHKKRHYQVTLRTAEEDKEYKIGRQWVVFNITPQDALLWVDSTAVKVRTGEAQMMLPLGKHTYRAESPFYDTEDGTVELIDVGRSIVEVKLHPIYSYLTVHTPMEGYDIYVDGTNIGRDEAVSGRLSEGVHNVKLYTSGVCVFNDTVNVGRAEKRTLTIVKDRYAKPIVVNEANGKPSRHSTSKSKQEEGGRLVASTKVAMQEVEIYAPDKETEIMIDREVVGEGSWQGELPLGIHAVQTRKEGAESNITWLELSGTEKKIVNMSVAKSSLGMVSVRSNVVDAEIWIGGELKGYTPCIIENLPANKPCLITLKKNGFKESSKAVTPTGNNMIETTIKLKRDGI